MPQSAIQTKDVDGTTYLFTYLPPRQALSLWTRLAKHLVPAIAAVVPKGGALLETELDLEGAAKHLSALLSDEKFQPDFDLLLTTVRLQDNSPVTIENFTGRIGHALKVVLAALEVNYADFFGDFKAVFARLKTTASTPAPTE